MLTAEYNVRNSVCEHMCMCAYMHVCTCLWRYVHVCRTLSGAACLYRKTWLLQEEQILRSTGLCVEALLTNLKLLIK